MLKFKKETIKKTKYKLDLNSICCSDLKKAIEYKWVMIFETSKCGKNENYIALGGDGISYGLYYCPFCGEKL